jgi:hypothetical protein
LEDKNCSKELEVATIRMGRLEADLFEALEKLHYCHITVSELREHIKDLHLRMRQSENRKDE